MDESAHPRVFIFSLIIGALLLFLVVGSFFHAKNRTGTVVLPGGITYIGPTPTKQPTAATSDGKIPISESVAWVEKKGSVFPYTFEYPQSLSLGVFPNDPYDAVTIFYGDTDSNANIFFRVENLTTLKKTQYAGKTKEYANTWWKDYAWKRVASITPFTNSHGLSGYRAAYENDKGIVPYEHVFLDVPGHPNLVIWISGKLFSETVFNTLIDSVRWSQ